MDSFQKILLHLLLQESLRNVIPFQFPNPVPCFLANFGTSRPWQHLLFSAPRMGVTSHGMVLCAKSADKKVRCKSRLMVLVLLIKAWMMSTHRLIAVFDSRMSWA